jgi:hypothetical protein
MRLPACFTRYAPPFPVLLETEVAQGTIQRPRLCPGWRQWVLQDFDYAALAAALDTLASASINTRALNGLINTRCTRNELSLPTSDWLQASTTTYTEMSAELAVMPFRIDSIAVNASS